MKTTHMQAAQTFKRTLPRPLGSESGKIADDDFVFKMWATLLWEFVDIFKVEDPEFSTEEFINFILK